MPRLLPGGRLLGLDIDPIERPKTVARLLSRFARESFSAHAKNFAGLPRLLADEGLSGVDLVLVDLGVSSMQLDDPSRGFSWKVEGLLDLRMNPARGQPAWALLESMTEARLSRVLFENADEPHAEAIARAVVLARKERPIRTTTAFAGIVAEATTAAGEEAAFFSQARAFQALRIEVNDEMSALEALLRALPSCLKPGGRAAFLSFHSGEDRRVKRAFRLGFHNGDYREIARDVIRAGPEEQRSNPRSTAAKLRFAIRA